MPIRPDVTYLIEHALDGGVSIALDAKVAQGHLQWFDTVRDRALRVISINESLDCIEIDTLAGRHTLTPMTVQLYEAKVRPFVIGAQRFVSDYELQMFYRRFPR